MKRIGYAKTWKKGVMKKPFHYDCHARHSAGYKIPCGYCGRWRRNRAYYFIAQAELDREIWEDYWYSEYDEIAEEVEAFNHWDDPEEEEALEYWAGDVPEP